MAAVEVSTLDLELPLPSDGESRLLQGGVIRRFRLRLSRGAVQRLLDPLALQIRLVENGAVLEKQLGLVRVVADVVGSVSARGALKVEATSVRAGGWLPVPQRLVSMALGGAPSKPGLRVTGPQSLELDLAEVLEHLLQPWGWQVPARIRQVRISSDYLEVECDSPTDERLDPA